MANIFSATFADRNDAEKTVDWLRSRGVPEDAITIVGRRGGDGDAGGRDAGDAASDAGGGALTGAGIGAAVGALFGLAAFAIPGVGPFITAGALANALGAAGGAAASGALVGAASGGLAGALSHWGLNEAEARHYAGEVESGNTYVGVDLDRANVDRETVRQAFRDQNARMDMGTPGMAGTMAGGSSPTTAQSFAGTPTRTDQEYTDTAMRRDGTTQVGSYGAPGLAPEDHDLVDDTVDHAHTRSL